MPEGEGDYFSWPLLTDLFPWQHSGSQFKRTWPIGETPDLLEARWQALLSTTEHNRKVAFKESRDRNIDQTYASIEGSGRRLPPISSLGRGTSSIPTARYAFRSFDRQWAIPDPRLGDFLRPALWRAQSSRQIYLTTILSDVLGLGPAATVCSFVPDLHHFSGRGGKDAISLYRDAEATESNVTNNLLTIVADALGVEISAEDIFSYVYALLASSEYVDEFTEELTMPGPRVPITKTPSLFQRASELGRKLIWLHTYGARLIPEGEHIGHVPQGQARCRQGIPTEHIAYPETFSYDPSTKTLTVGSGIFSPIRPEIFEFSVSGFAVVQSWLNYRMKGGAGRSSSPLDEIRPENWTGDMTQELLEVLWVLEATVALFPDLKLVFDEIVASEVFRADELPQPAPEERRPRRKSPKRNSKKWTSKSGPRILRLCAVLVIQVIQLRAASIQSHVTVRFLGPFRFSCQ